MFHSSSAYEHEMNDAMAPTKRIPEENRAESTGETTTQKTKDRQHTRDK